MPKEPWYETWPVIVALLGAMIMGYVLAQVCADKPRECDAGSQHEQTGE